MNLFLVESPAKIKTIRKFLGKDFEIRASMGHIREIPKRGLGIDINYGFEPTFQLIESKSRNTTEILELMQKATMVWFAQDLDREGELIAWHLLKTANLPEEKARRVVFNEITKTAVQKAVENPRDLNYDLIGAGLARTILDRLIGYKLSPMIWKRFESEVPLSVGRVQTAALRVLVDREREIAAFVKEEFWNVRADFAAEGFTANIQLPKDQKLTPEEARELLKKLESPKASVTEVEGKREKRNPRSPFTTATLQQEASTKLKLSAKQTMQIAQELYEGVDLGGESKALITYMRTDAANLSDEAIEAIRKRIAGDYGKEYLPKKPRVFEKKSKNAQEAHEAIRPTDFSLPPQEIKRYLKPTHFKLYELIWSKAVACQMAPAEFDSATADIHINSIAFRARGSMLVFDGFLKAYDDRDLDKKKDESGMLPPLEKGQDLSTPKIVGEKKFTKPPARYTEASLVKFLEKHGIGRPSTYATIIDTLQRRLYAELDSKNRFNATELGCQVCDWVRDNFSSIVDIGFTANVEESLDQVARGENEWKQIVDSFYTPLKERIVSLTGFAEEDLDEEEKRCPECGQELMIRSGKFGPFLGCSGFPGCTYIKPTRKGGSRNSSSRVTTGIFCEQCGSEFLLRQSKHGKYFACSNWPDCSNKRNSLTVDEVKQFQQHRKKLKEGRLHEST